jgi:8-oxo-dGTP pyrophosphatase MutT (NUDIX family)
MPGEPSPRPQRRSVAAVALIRRRYGGPMRHLVQWNANWAAFHFVGGHKRPGETFRDCLVREVGEELGLAEAVDFAAPAEPVVHLEFDAMSASTGRMTAYTMEVFEVEILGDAALAKVAANPENRWVSEAEIHSGRCGDGTPISPTTELILSMLGRPRG